MRANNRDKVWRRATWLFQWCCRRRCCCLGFLLRMPDVRTKQGKFFWPCKAGDIFLSKLCCFHTNLSPFQESIQRFLKNWQPASICDRINKRVCEMQNSSHQNDFGWNTFFAKDVTNDVKNDSWNPTSKWQCDDQKYRFWEFYVSFHASPLITVKYLGWAFQRGAYNDVRKTSGKNG